MCFSFKLSVGELPFRINAIVSPNHNAKVTNWGIVEIFSLHLSCLRFWQLIHMLVTPEHGISEEHVKERAAVYTLSSYVFTPRISQVCFSPPEYI